MSLFSQSFLQRIGVNISDQEFAPFRTYFFDTLNNRIIAEVVESLETPQLEQLAAIRNHSEDEVQKWLATNIPNLKDIIEQEISILVGEIAESSDQF